MGRSREESSSELDANEREYFLGDKSSPLPHTQSPARRISRWLILLLILNVVLFISSAAMFGTWFYHTHLRLNAKIRQASTYSPVHDRFDLQMSPSRVNGSLFTPSHDPSIARQQPNPAADAIWQEWELTRVIPITASDILAMGKDPSTAAKLEDADWGLGDDAYAAIFDTYHHLHCLNLFRQIAHADYYFDDIEGMHLKKVEGMWDIHINHCVDMLMQALQCSGNVNLITMHWMETQEYPYPDMSVNRQCVDFDGLTQWRRENTIDMDKYVKVMKMPRFPDAKKLKAPDDYYRYYEPNITNPNHLNGANPGEDFNS